jgi:hypothetical protein
VNSGQRNDRARQLSGRPHQGLEAIRYAQTRNPNRTDLENGRTRRAETRGLEIDDDEIRRFDRLLGEFAFRVGTKIAWVELLGKRPGRAIQRQRHHASRQRGIDRSIDREQVLREFDQPHGLAGFTQPIQ